MASQNLGIVQLHPRLQHGQGVILCYCRLLPLLYTSLTEWEGAHIDLTLMMGIVRADRRATHCSGFHFSSSLIKALT